jgi:electron transport complex protein RnfD
VKKRDPDLLLFHAPLLRQGMTTPNAMRDVLYALAPATAASLWFFGISAVLVLSTCIAGAVLAEWLFANEQARGESLLDASGILTGLLLGLTLPPGLPLWMAFLGGFVGIALHSCSRHSRLP